MQDTCLPQNYVNCIGKVKVCGCRRFRESVLYGQCLFCSSPCLPLSFLCFIIFSYYNVRARVWVWGCCKFCKFASLPSVFSLFLFSVCCFRMGSFLFPSLYARANIIMCVSFSSGVLRYKNMLCNTSVIQRITKKFQEIRIIFPSYVCWLSLKGLPLHPQSREMRHFRQCVTDLVKQT